MLSLNLRPTSGVMEGINNKIKVIKRQAYGSTNFGHLPMGLMACFSHWSYLSPSSQESRFNL
ncbi:transposase [Synechococcus sp. PCC 6312]|uniref:transposase n=1 Tax=Synechococcus sp. (strain ATCC 27167 / PCC 6312) TaxID=195253 RepID=UPI0021102B0A|nr:transposase [Synechococcus sp. PCC 6312]